jgi:hypothetical protein
VRLEELRTGIASGQVQLDADILALDALRETVMATGEAVTALRARADVLEASIKDARGVLDAIRAAVSGAGRRPRHRGGGPLTSRLHL